MLDINSSIQKNGTLSVQNSDGTLKQVLICQLQSVKAAQLVCQLALMILRHT